MSHSTAREGLTASLERSVLTLCELVQALRDREVCVYSISCKSQNNIDITLDWLTKHAKS